MLKKVKLLELVEAEQSLVKLSQKPIKDIKLSYWIGRLLKRIEKEVSLVKEANKKLIKEMGEEQKDEAGNVTGFQVKDSDKSLYNQKIDELFNEEIDIEIPENYNIDSFVDLGIVIEPEIFKNLGFWLS